MSELISFVGEGPANDLEYILRAEVITVSQVLEVPQTFHETPHPPEPAIDSVHGTVELGHAWDSNGRPLVVHVVLNRRQDTGEVVGGSQFGQDARVRRLKIEKGLKLRVDGPEPNGIRRGMLIAPVASSAR